MKTIKCLILLLLFSTGVLNMASAQTITVTANPTSLPCGGGNVNLTAVGTSSTPVFGDNFNTGGVAPGWSASASAQFNNPCGASVDGTTYLWMGSSTSAPREMTTAPVDVSCGGTVCFDFKFVCESCGDSAPCEGADLYNEGVSLQCSTDGGTTWTDFGYFAPNGDLLTAYPGGVTSPSASGNTPFTTWQNYCFTIPAGCETANTMFQLHQWGSSGSNYDHWGIDNFYVYANPCAPYYYDWDHIPGSPDSPNVTTNITSTTTFTCCYTNGIDSVCESVTIVVDSLPPAVVVTTWAPSCFGASDGGVIIDNPGGMGPYNITVTGPVTDTYTEGNGPPDDLNIDDLPAGTYTYTTNQQNGNCTNTGTFTIAPGPPCCEVDASSVDVLCNGDATGSATATPLDGIGPFTYQWDDPGTQTTQSAGGLTAGSYSVIMTDDIGCQDTAFITVTEPPAVSGTNTPTNVSCLGACDGSISVTGSGGTPGYLYNLNGGTFGLNTNFTNLCAGTYNVTVQDANGCQFNMTNISITQPTDLTLIEVGTTVATCGGSDGSLTVAAGGGTAPYLYDIGGAQQASATFSNLAAGTYTVTVTDDNGCTETVNVTVGSAVGPAPFIDVQNDVACAGAFTGSVTIGVTGGTAPFTYTMFAPSGSGIPQASNTFTGVPAGPFTVEVTDAFGCTGTVNGTITQPTPITFSSVPQDATCAGVCDGEITVTANNATPPYMYSSDNGLTFQPSNVLTGLCAGNIDVVVQDANGCLANAVVPVGEPAPVDFSPTFTEPSCNGLSDGSIAFNGSGGTAPYTYSTDDGVTYVPGVNDTVYGIAAGWYELAIMDANGCTAFDTLTVTEPPPFTFNYIANNPSNCGASDGSFEITAVGGVGPYLYSIDNNVTQQFNNGFFLNLYSGLYTLVVTDLNSGCMDSTIEALSDNVMVTQTDTTVDATCFNSCDGLAIVSQQFGQPPYTYTLDFNTSSQPFGVFNSICAGTHFITITDNGLCLGIEQFTIGQPDSIIIFTSADSVSCPGGADGQITVTSATGGDGGPYTYSIDGVNFQASNVITGLAPGTYTVWAQDGNGCLGTDDITVYEPAPWNVFINQTDLVCNGDFTGFIQIIGGGATPSYTYTLNGVPSVPASSGVFPGLSANPSYTLQVTDSHGCTFDTTQAVNEPPALTGAYVPTDALCFGAADGTIDVTAGGGTPPYLYSSDNGTTLQSSNVLTGLAAGCYDVLIQDNNGCQLVSNECLSEPTPVSMTLAITPATCGNANGEVTITGSGGTPGYQYSNDGGTTFQGGTTFTGLAAQNYVMVAEDVNGCQADSLITITVDPAPQIDNVVFTNPLCNGSLDGSLTITSSSGVGAHQYSIDNGVTFQASNTFTGIGAGVYDIVVQDINGCTATQQTTLTDPPLLTLASVPTDLSCNGNFSGQIVITANGGTPPYAYSVDNGVTLQGQGSFSGLAAGNYNTYVQDANGCNTTGLETVNEPAALTWSTFTITDPVCFGSCDGTISTTTTGGTGAYTYNWSGNIAGPNDQNAAGVCAGTYTVTLTDANGCQLDSTNFVLTDPPNMTIDGVTTTDVLCYGGNTGTITVGNITNGTAPYDYSFDGGTTYQGVGNNVYGDVNGGPVTIGNYDIVVQDANGCEALSNVTIYQPDSLYSLAPSNWVSCMNETAVVQAFSNGGSVPYTYQWTNDVNGNIETNPIFNHVVTQPVTFTLTVTDANGCVAAPVSYTITPTPGMALTPTPDTSICLGGEASLGISVTGGQLIDFGSTLDYSYTWSPAGANDTLNTFNVSPTTQTTYTITVEDLCGEILDTTITVGINPDPVMPTIPAYEGCAPDTLEFDISSVILPGYTVTWDFDNGQVSNSPTPSNIIYLYPGLYEPSLTITTDMGCTATATTPSAVTIHDNPTPGFYFDPYSPSVLKPNVQIVDISQGAEFYTYTFEEYGTSNEAEPYMSFDVEEETTINVCQKIVSAEGCPAEVCVPLDIHEEVLFYVPNVVTPDGDLFNETFFPVFTSGVDPFDYHLTIFNRWGEIVFESYDYNYGWNCHYGDGGLVKDGVYIWQIEFGEKLTDKKQMHRGHVTVLK
ncbi:MAG: gliding motility-associated C-terminal domain-containing protein [Crocinitomicaceae bacterium]|nr:gliding motility-associated C-terminal domain-containing protein [Crocinitomicaceae bacterium]